MNKNYINSNYFSKINKNFLNSNNQANTTDTSTHALYSSNSSSFKDSNSNKITNKINHVSAAYYIKKRLEDMKKEEIVHDHYKSDNYNSEYEEGQIWELKSKRNKENRNSIEDFLSLSRYHSNYQGSVLKQEPKLLEIFNYVQNNK